MWQEELERRTSIDIGVLSTFLCQTYLLLPQSLFSNDIAKMTYLLLIIWIACSPVPPDSKNVEEEYASSEEEA